MAEMDLLLSAYAAHVSTPWRDGLSGSERVWFLVYSPSNERRLRRRLDEFAIATRDAGHGWRHLDLTDAFPQWITAERHTEGYFKRPEGVPEKRLIQFAADRIRAALESASDRDVVALSGIGTVFGITPLSPILTAIDGEIKGRLLVSFPGTYERDFHRYRLLDAGEGWNYLAAPILAQHKVIP